MSGSRLSAALAAILWLVPCVVLAGEPSFQKGDFVVTTRAVSVQSGLHKLAEIPAGRLLELHAVSGSWVRVEIDGGQGWIQRDGVRPPVAADLRRVAETLALDETALDRAKAAGLPEAIAAAQRAARSLRTLLAMTKRTYPDDAQTLDAWRGDLADLLQWLVDRYLRCQDGEAASAARKELRMLHREMTGFLVKETPVITVRSTPLLTDGRVLATVPEETRLVILDFSGDRLKCDVAGRTGWIDIADVSKRSMAEIHSMEDGRLKYVFEGRAVSLESFISVTSQEYLEGLAAHLELLAENCEEVEAFERAVAARRDLLRLKRHLLGDGHWEIATVQWTLRRAERLAAMTEEKRRAVKQIDELRLRVEQLKSVGRIDEAIRLGKEMLARCERFWGDNDLETARCAAALATLHCEVGSYEDAQFLYRRALDVEKAILGEEHPDYASMLNELCEVYRVTGEYDKAEPLGLKGTTGPH